jgi:transposase-like protein
VHFMRNALAHAGKSGRRVVSAFIATAFAQDHADAARAQWRQVADQVRTKLPKLAALLDELAYMSFPKEHRAKIHSTDEIDKSRQHPVLERRAVPERARLACQHRHIVPRIVHGLAAAEDPRRCSPTTRPSWRSSTREAVTRCAPARAISCLLSQQPGPRLKGQLMLTR